MFNKDKKTKMSLKTQAILLLAGAAIAAPMFYVAMQGAQSERDTLAMLRSYTSALVLDLDGRGMNTTGLDRGIHFDHNGNGFAQNSGWVQGETALLVLDLDGDGLIGSGLELIGGNARLASGLPAALGQIRLRELDTNQDGVLDRDDTDWDRLMLWLPDEAEGIASGGRFLSMAAAGISSISLDFSPDGSADAHGNAQHSRALVTLVDGSTTDLIEIEFNVDHARAKPLHLVELPERIERLPSLPGLGTLYHLHQAMARDDTGALEEAVARFTEERSPGQRREILHEILYAWAGVTHLDSSSRGGNIDARQLAVVEASLGKNFLQQGKEPNPRPQAARLLKQGYDAIHDESYASLMRQTHLRPYAYQIEIVFGEKDEAGRRIKLSAAQLPALFSKDRESDRGWALDNLLEFMTHGHEILEIIDLDQFRLTDVVLPWILEDLASGHPPFWETSELAIRGQGKITGTERDNVLIGSQAGDRIEGNGGNNLLVAGPGGNTLVAGTGHTIYVFGPGEDTAISRHRDASDIYLLRRGDGVNTVQRSGGTGRILLSPGIRPDQVNLVRDETDMVLMVDTGEKLVVTGAHNRSGRLQPGRAISEVIFHDGTRWQVTL
jgi:hypothetical protein